jgi:hypothetical protein
MKSFMIGFALVTGVGIVYAEDIPPEIMRELLKRSMEENTRAQANEVTPEMAAQERAIKRATQEKGYIDVSDAELEDVIKGRPRGLRRPWEEIKQKTALGRPARLEDTQLANAIFEAAIADPGPGVYTRIYRLGKDIVELEELDYVAMGNPPGHVNPELANVMVGGRPAVLLVKKSPRHKVSELTWLMDQKLYVLRTTLPRGQLLKLAEEITAAGTESR